MIVLASLFVEVDGKGLAVSQLLFLHQFPGGIQ